LPRMYLEYHGWINIEYWEYAMLFFYLVVIYMYFARRKNLMVKQRPEYRYLLWGLYAKLLGGVAFSLIYFYYYGGGDTIGYFSCTLAMSKLFVKSPVDFLTVLFGPGTAEMRQYFDTDTGWPYLYVLTDPHQWTVVRLVSPLTILSFNSYIITTVMVAGLTYAGIWRLYVTLYRYFPSLHMELAVAVLFMPSSILWGSAILKDSFTFTSFCWFIYAVDQLFFVRRDQVSATVALVLSSLVMLAIKPYIFMAIFPTSLLWVMYKRLASIRNALVKYILLPVGFFAMVALSFVVLDALGDNLGKFSLDSALDTVVITQTDLKRSEEYGNNYFDVGELDASWGSVLSKFPIALNAALFRPYLIECHNFTMVMSGLENLWLLILFIRVLWLTRIVHLPTCITKNPLVLTCITFTIMFGFITGITTPNFGALVRFKIPLLPMFVAGMYIIRFLMNERHQRLTQGRKFRYEDYRNGEPGSLAARNVIFLEAQRKKGR
jgi:hypothetical protein